MSKIIKKSKSKSVDTNIFSHPTLFPLSSINKKPVEVSFTAEKISTDGGLLLLSEVEKNIVCSPLNLPAGQSGSGDSE